MHSPQPQPHMRMYSCQHVRAQQRRSCKAPADLQTLPQVLRAPQLRTPKNADHIVCASTGTATRHRAGSHALGCRCTWHHACCSTAQAAGQAQPAGKTPGNTSSLTEGPEGCGHAQAAQLAAFAEGSSSQLRLPTGKRQPALKGLQKKHCQTSGAGALNSGAAAPVSEQADQDGCCDHKGVGEQPAGGRLHAGLKGLSPGAALHALPWGCQGSGRSLLSAASRAPKQAAAGPPAPGPPGFLRLRGVRQQGPPRLHDAAHAAAGVQQLACASAARVSPAASGARNSMSGARELGPHAAGRGRACQRLEQVRLAVNHAWPHEHRRAPGLAWGQVLLGKLHGKLHRGARALPTSARQAAERLGH